MEKIIFDKSEWIKGNLGKDNNNDLNDNFELLYRYLNIKSSPTEKKERTNNSFKTTKHKGGENSVWDGEEYNCPQDNCLSSSTSVFENLTSITSARSNINRLNIGYDCEYYSISHKERIILSYQFSLYLNDKSTILEFAFLTKNPIKENRLTLRQCLGSILDIISKDYGYNTIEYKQARKYIYNISYYKTNPTTGEKEKFNEKKKFDTIEELKEYKSSIENDSSIYVCDGSKINKTKLELKPFYKTHSFKICIVSHSGSVDLTAFKKDKHIFKFKNGEILPYLSDIHGGAVSISNYYMHIPSANEYWKFYLVDILFRDTMCYVPSEGRSLSVLGNCINIPKISLPDGVIEHMDDYLLNNKHNFLEYAVNDALITLVYASSLWGINLEFPLTTTVGSSNVVKKILYNYFKLKDKKDFNAIYRGKKVIDNGMIDTPYGLRPQKNLVHLNSNAATLENFSSKAYYGGYNASFIIGVYKDILTYDFDLENAYPTAMCLIPDIDYSKNIKLYSDVDLSLLNFDSPIDPIFCEVDFEFPKDIMFPCLAIRENGNIVFPLKGITYASGPSLYLALQLGCKIHIINGVKAQLRYNEDGSTSKSLSIACKQMISDRNTAKDIYGKGSINEKLIKLFINAIYGKIAQSVIPKTRWNLWLEQSEDLLPSEITCPERACLITDIIRSMLIATLNQLHLKGFLTYSVTTDGFITNATLNDLNNCDCYGFRDLFLKARRFLVDNENPSIWSIKHAQTLLLNTTTRCNTGFGSDKYEGVNAHGSYITHEVPDTYEDRIAMFKAITQRTGTLDYTVKEFINMKDMYKKKQDFHTYERTIKLKMNFDMKRKPDFNSMNTVTGSFDKIDYEYYNFSTYPFSDIEEYRLYKNISDTFDCLRTKEDWDIFEARLYYKNKGYSTKIIKSSWNKLKSVIMGYRMGLWNIPALDNNNLSVNEKLKIINDIYHKYHPEDSNLEFKLSNWKDARKPERQKRILDIEIIKDMLDEFEVEINKKRS